jgi:hypothetical protein
VDGVVTFHTNPFACGVARFNEQLAEKLKLPLLTFSTVTEARHPLFSVKWSELDESAKRMLRQRASKTFDLFWHGEAPEGISSRAERVYHASEIGCPSTVQGNPRRSGLNILTFGMANKIQLKYHHRLQPILEAQDPGYTVSLSTAIHEGSPWAESFHRSVNALRGVYGDHLRVLGFLADDALTRELSEATACALFFDPALRANNTSYWAAVEQNCLVLTNLDHLSPAVHPSSDIRTLDEWPDFHRREEMRGSAARAMKQYSWDRVLDALQAVHA